jgi:citrate lyase subunit beta / citryl-CoA lyase
VNSAGRSFLFVPATRPDRVDKALNGDADVVIVDLEDAVGPADKASARAALGSWTSTRPYLLRINAIGSPFHDDDVRAVESLARVAGVVLPKAEHTDEVRAVLGRLSSQVELHALVESAVGLLRASDIARSGVERLMFGSADYLADLGVVASRDVLAFPRSCLVVASAAAGLPPPVDGPTLAFDDPTTTEADALDAKALGLGGKLCIHPTQLEPVNRVFAPSPDELTWARRVVERAAAGDGGAFALDGAMIDEPVLRRARRILDAGENS